MKRTTESKNILSLYVIVFALGIIIVFGIMEFRFLKNILTSYENSIKQIAINKTNSFLNDLKSISRNAARMIELQHINIDEAVNVVQTYDRRITNVYLVEDNGTIHSSVHDNINKTYISKLAQKAASKKTEPQIIISEVKNDRFSKFNVISMAVPLHENGGVLIIDFSIDQYQREVIEEFTNTNYKLAVFDSENNPIIWPFDQDQLTGFNWEQSKFYVQNELYQVIKSKVGQPPWQLYLFQKENNFEKYRAVTIIFLVFALYYCLYQLLVEFWGVNSAKTYFDNIDFAILNQVNEGVIITNNAGVIVFANKAAHNIFTERKSNLVNVKLKEVMGYIEDFRSEGDNSKTLTLKTSDKLLQAIHSPIIKKGKKLGSLTVIRANTDEQKALRNVLDKLVEIIPEGIIYVDKNNEIITANLMAKCYLGALDRGKSISVIDSSLAEFICKNIDSRTINRIKLTAHDVWCDVAPVYDDDGVYTGTLLVLLNNDTKV
ncbi:PAS domain-containing protein [Desulfohalotomaculum tongense]|uniref:PAS domain-containing protein n=1 Tax=Desulforadius tongensis TaxID=1216062 RepID=UPI00195AE02F|nr:PAS domain-containing protein [Desulforadius tongensis]MBM7854872.1 PAS domain-containing protein [Desulforadius tongensis]